MIDRTHELPIVRQAQWVGVSRGAVYYLPQPVSPADLALMRRIDALHLEHPFLGARLLRDVLKREGFAVGRKHVATLMRRMGIEPLYRKPNTSRKHPGHAVYPYLLRGLAIERANHVWAMDITYIPMARGFVYLELTPFRGHLILKEKGVRYANDEAALPGGVQATDGRAGARRAQPGRAWARVQVQRTEHLDVGSARCGRQACAAALANPRARRAQ
jgi:putative transposase